MFFLRVLAAPFLFIFLTMWWIWDLALGVVYLFVGFFHFLKDEIRDAQEFQAKFKREPREKPKISGKVFPFQTFRR